MGQAGGRDDPTTWFSRRLRGRRHSAVPSWAVRSI